MVTLLYAGMLGIFYVALGFYVVKNRRLHRVSLGVGKDIPALERAVRIHGNFAENVPLFIVLLALIEMNGAHLWIIHTLGIMMLLGRLSHFLGIKHHEGASRERFIGMILTWLSLSAAAVLALILFLHTVTS